MTDRQNMVRNMIRGVIALFAAHPSIVALIPALQPTIDRQVGVVDEIDAKDNLLQSLSVGSVTAKNQAKARLKQMIQFLASKLEAFAIQNNNPQLADQADHLYKSSIKIRETQLISVSNALSELLTGVGPDLADYGAGAPQIAALASVRDAFEAAFVSRTQQVTQRIQLNKELRQLFKEANRILSKELDTLMLTFKTTQPEFYSEYKIARRILDRGVRHNHNDEPPAEPPA